MENTQKPSSDIFTNTELKTCLLKRAKTTGFSSSRNNINVSFKLFSNMASADKVFSTAFYKMLNEAVDNTIVITDKGKLRVRRIDYAFVDANGLAVTVLDNGEEAIILKENTKNGTFSPIIVKSIEDLELSTKRLKDYVLDNLGEFPKLSELTMLLKSVEIGEDDRKTIICALASRGRNNNYIISSLPEYLTEMKNLFRNASFVINKRL